MGAAPWRVLDLIWGFLLIITRETQSSLNIQVTAKENLTGYEKRAVTVAVTFICFLHPLQLFTKAINVHYKFSSLGKDITEYKEHFKLWSINEVQGNTSVRKQNTLCSPFSHFQCNRSLSTYPGKQDAHLPTTEFELLRNILFPKLNQGQETTRVTWPSHSIWPSLPFPFLLNSLSWEIIHNMLRWQVGLRVVQDDWPLGETKINTAN